MSRKHSKTIITIIFYLFKSKHGVEIECGWFKRLQIDFNCLGHVSNPITLFDGVQVSGTDGLVVGRGMMFGEVVGTVCGAFAPVDLKLALAYAIADPVKTHVDRFGPFLFDSVSDNSTGGVIIGGHRGGWLRVPHFGKSNAERACFFAIVEERTEFGFSCAG